MSADVESQIKKLDYFKFFPIVTVQYFPDNVINTVTGPGTANCCPNAAFAADMPYTSPSEQQVGQVKPR